MFGALNKLVVELWFVKSWKVEDNLGVYADFGTIYAVFGLVVVWLSKQCVQNLQSQRTSPYTGKYTPLPGMAWQMSL